MLTALQQARSTANTNSTGGPHEIYQLAPHYLEIVKMTVYALFDSSGTLIGMDSAERDGFEQVEFNFGDRIVKVDGAVREMTADEIAAADTAANNAALAEIHRGERNRLLAESDFVVTRALEAGDSVPSAWATYRTALRDITGNSDWPNLKLVIGLQSHKKSAWRLNK